MAERGKRRRGDIWTSSKTLDTLGEKIKRRFPPWNRERESQSQGSMLIFALGRLIIIPQSTSFSHPFQLEALVVRLQSRESSSFMYVGLVAHSHTHISCVKCRKRQVTELKLNSLLLNITTSRYEHSSIERASLMTWHVIHEDFYVFRSRFSALLPLTQQWERDTQHHQKFLEQSLKTSFSHTKCSPKQQQTGCKRRRREEALQCEEV